MVPGLSCDREDGVSWALDGEDGGARLLSVRVSGPPGRSSGRAGGVCDEAEVGGSPRSPGEEALTPAVDVGSVQGRRGRRHEDRGRSATALREARPMAPRRASVPASSPGRRLHGQAAAAGFSRPWLRRRPKIPGAAPSWWGARGRPEPEPALHETAAGTGSPPSPATAGPRPGKAAPSGSLQTARERGSPLLRAEASLPLTRRLSPRPPPKNWGLSSLSHAPSPP